MSPACLSCSACYQGGWMAGSPCIKHNADKLLPVHPVFLEKTVKVSQKTHIWFDVVSSPHAQIKVMGTIQCDWKRHHSYEFLLQKQKKSIDSLKLTCPIPVLTCQGKLHPPADWPTLNHKQNVKMYISQATGAPWANGCLRSA